MLITQYSANINIGLEVNDRYEVREVVISIIISII